MRQTPNKNDKTTSTYIKYIKLPYLKVCCILNKKFTGRSTIFSYFFPAMSVLPKMEPWEGRWAQWTFVVKIMQLMIEKACSCGSLAYQRLVWARAKKRSMSVHVRTFKHSTCCLPSMGQNRLNMGFPRFNVLSCLPQYLTLNYPYDISVDSLNCTLDSVLYTASMFRFWYVSCLDVSLSLRTGKRLNESMPLPYHTRKLGLLTYQKTLSKMQRKRWDESILRVFSKYSYK